jgi:hypothetical protein
VKVGKMRLMLESQGIYWENLPGEMRHGQWAYKAGGLREITYHDKRDGEQHTAMAYRTWWETEPAELEYPTNVAHMVKSYVPA